MINIEKGIPIPQKQVGREAKYPFAKMAVGDSFLCGPESTQRGIGATLARAGRTHGAIFSSRLLASGRVRVWRTA